MFVGNNNQEAVGNSKEKNLIRIFEKWSGQEVHDFSVLPRSGSYREYYRLKNHHKNAIGVYNEDKKENIAFISFTKHFYNNGLKVPQIYEEDLDQNVYLQEDLGDTTLFAHLTQERKGKEFPSSLVQIYQKVVSDLPLFQVSAAQDLDYSVCYPRASFDKQSMMWDLNYFKYYFLKLAKIPFDEQELEDDFQTFSNFLLQEKRNYFLYRDFQSRNIMILHDEPYYIDYQGGRRGALQYDLASLLYDAKADIPQQIRDELLQYYIDNLARFLTIDETKFREYYQGYVLIRMMQAMGAYGFRGFYEKKTHFLQSIPHSLNNLAHVVENYNLPVKLPALMDVFEKILLSPHLKKFKDYTSWQKALKVTINSFSYKKGIPIDHSGHGGGFVFDCRAIHNPGRYDKFKQLTGKDKKVIDFLKNKSDVGRFLQNVYEIVGQSVDTYIERDFSHLMINFGCTGGQHRSVYCAEKLASHLREKYNVDVELNHRELENIERQLKTVSS